MGSVIPSRVLTEMGREAVEKIATYYAKKRAEGKKHRVAITHVAKKLIRVIYALERQDVDFNVQKLR